MSMTTLRSGLAALVVAASVAAAPVLNQLNQTALVYGGGYGGGHGNGYGNGHEYEYSDFSLFDTCDW